MARKAYSDEQIILDIKTKLTVPIWPHVGRAYDIGKGASYNLAHRGLAAGDGTVVQEGRILRAVTAPLRKRLGI